MPAKIGLTETNEITPALAKKLAGRHLEHVTAADLIHKSDGKQDYLYAQGVSSGALLDPALQEALDYAITHLPIPKVMRRSEEHTSALQSLMRISYSVFCL